ncbi:MAG: outer membrane lipoprotein-sorting protein [Candidatus Omnitrophota bacterium]|nr:outer membrane lipoprotein-sorting protein [Candidatus Omnitrophota bacterium]
MQNLKSCLLLIAGALFSVVILTTPVPAESSLPEVPRPYPGISADDLMKMWFEVKYTTFTRDIELKGDYRLFSKKGQVIKNWRFIRSRIVLNRKSKDINYKDLIVMTSPPNVKGMGILTWTYLDTERLQDIWLWIPSLKKIRRISPGQAEGAFMGSDLTNAEVSTRKFGDETYKLTGEEKFKGYYCDFAEKNYYQGMDCYVIEAKPKNDRWYYTKRIVWIDKATGANIFEEMFDETGRKFKTIFRSYKSYTNRGYPAQIILECKNLRTGSTTVIKNDEIKFDIGLKEGLFTEKTLMRSRW